MAARKILVVDPDRATLSFLAALLTQEGYDVTTAMLGREAQQKAELSPPDLVIVARELPDMSGMELVQGLREAPGASGFKVICFCSATDTNEILAFLQAGADDHVTKRPGADQEILTRVRVLLAEPAESPAARKPPPGKLISFFSAKGGTGTSVICANFGCALAERVKPRKVGLVDLVLPLGSMRQILGVDSTESIAALTHLPREQINEATVSQALVTVRDWGLEAMLGARDPAEARGLRVDPLEPIFGVLRSMFDYTLVDLGRSLSRIGIPIIQQSEMIVVVVGTDLNTIHLTKTCLDYFSSLGIAPSQLFIVLNRAVGLAGLTKEQIEDTLHLPVAGTIPYGGGDFTMVLNQARPFVLAYPSQTVSLMVRELVEDLQARVDQG